MQKESSEKFQQQAEKSNISFNFDLKRWIAVFSSPRIGNLGTYYDGKNVSKIHFLEYKKVSYNIIY